MPGHLEPASFRGICGQIGTPSSLCGKKFTKVARVAESQRHGLVDWHKVVAQASESQGSTSERQMRPKKPQTVSSEKRLKSRLFL